MRAIELNVTGEISSGAMGEYILELFNKGVTHIVIRTTEEFDDALEKKREENTVRVAKEVSLINGEK